MKQELPKELSSQKFLHLINNYQSLSCIVLFCGWTELWKQLIGEVSYFFNS